MQANLCKRDGGEDDSDGGGLPLPDDIILEVLLRLPAKALCRFRCMCKAWCALIPDTVFAVAQRSRAGPFIVSMFRFVPEHELRLLDKEGNVLRVFDVRGGTSLLAPTRLDLIFVDRAQLGAMIIDPASGREFTVVGTNDPPPPAWWNKSSSTSRAGSDYSFGHAAASDDYKVLRLHVTLSLWHGLSQWCEVATIMDGGAMPTWRQRPWGPFYDTSFSCEHKATVDGVLYFLPSNTCSASSQGRNRIAAFDLESEEWKPETMKCPPLERKEDQWRMSLTELKGTLCVVHNILRLGSFRVTMSTYGS